MLYYHATDADMYQFKHEQKGEHSIIVKLNMTVSVKHRKIENTCRCPGRVNVLSNIYFTILEPFKANLNFITRYI